MKFPIRINKYLAEKKYSTRKGADSLIEKGLIKINDRLAKLGDKVEKDDKVAVSEKAKNQKYIYLAYNKPVGISTNKDNKKDPHILSSTKFTSTNSAQVPLKVFPIGRLDKDSHGLIIMTNDGRITDRLLSPKYVHEKEYIVKTKVPFSDGFLDVLKKGVNIGGYKTKRCKAWRKGELRNFFHIILTEGKKRQIRRMCEALHHHVIDLQRIRIMNIHLKKEKPGEYREIKGEELEAFLKLLKIK